MTLPTQLERNPAGPRKLRPKPTAPRTPRPASTEGQKTGAAIEWTPVRQRVARRVQARGDKALLHRFMDKWTREEQE